MSENKIEIVKGKKIINPINRKSYIIQDIFLRNYGWFVTLYEDNPNEDELFVKLSVVEKWIKNDT